MKTTGLLLSISITAIIISSPLFAYHNTPESLLKDYLHALRNPDVVHVESLWVADDVARANNLGIKFEGIKTKIDCASSLIYDDKFLFSSMCKDEVSIDFVDSIKARGTIKVKCLDRDSTVNSYYMIKENDRWRLCSSMHFYTSFWYRVDSKYFHIIFEDSSLINNYAIDALDSFTDSLAQVLDIPKSRMIELGQKKIEYFLCSKDQMITLTDHDAHGMTSFPFDCIITCHLPHQHEVTHLMINYALKELPLFTLPIMQEGLACCLGGRWGKSPDVIKYWGASIENLDLLDIDSLLTVRGFYSCPVGVDGSYAASALLVEALISGFGPGKFIELYESLSGDEEFVTSTTTEVIKDKICEINCTTWERVLELYNHQVISNLNCNIFFKDPPEKHFRSMNSSGSDFGVTIIEDSTSLYFTIWYYTKHDKGITLITPRETKINRKYSSWQFNEQTSDPYSRNYYYGICFDPGEVGVYDYFTNTLIAKYVHSFNPNEKFWNPHNRILSFCLDKKHLNIDFDNVHRKTYRR